MAHLPTIQCLLKLVMTVLSLVYVVHTKPHDDRLQNRMEMINEICILVFDYHLLLLMTKPSVDVVDPNQGELLYNVGWSFIGVFIVFLFSNISLLIMISVKQGLIKRKRNKMIKELEKNAPLQ